MWRALGLIVVLVAGGALVGVFALGSGWLTERPGPGVATATPIPAELLDERAAAQRSAAEILGVPQPRQILFGDLHVHTTYSLDAFMLSLPISQGDGAHPPADACDYARFCSALDFWSINDHAEAMTPENWTDTVASIRQCNAVSGAGESADSVAFLGWEWTQVGDRASNHYGHKNVILRDLEDGRIPARPIAARIIGTSDRDLSVSPLTLGLLPFIARDPAYLDMVEYLRNVVDVAPCPDGVPVRDLPLDCRESAATPQALFAKLDEWGHATTVIPHGTTWGFYTPLGSSWDRQLARAQHDPDRQRLIEVYSGHGNSEEYRAWREVLLDSKGEASCPPAAPSYLPSCRRAGEIIAERCRAAGESVEECRTRASEARKNYVDGDVHGFLTVPGAQAGDWLDAGQCSDCFQPSFNYRPRSSAQYILALSSYEDAEPMRFRFGFIAASDNHSSRPGTGYKEFARRETTEAGFGKFANGIIPGLEQETPPAEARSLPWQPRATQFDFFQVRETERGSSFFVTGGLAAVHAPGRSRGEIWDALQRKEVYGTSGPRILLWFDLLNAPAGGDRMVKVAMGGEARLGRNPVFEVRAAGSLVQVPGCPEYAVNALSPERLQRLCRGECYHPSDERRAITRIEVVRVRPRVEEGESVGRLIEDPWRVLPCPRDPAGCRVVFDDPDFAADGRDTAYYVRAVEEPSPAVNAGNLRCERDERGRCLATSPCEHVPYQEDCLAETEQRAWSSPIFVDFGEE